MTWFSPSKCPWSKRNPPDENASELFLPLLLEHQARALGHYPTALSHCWGVEQIGV